MSAVTLNRLFATSSRRLFLYCAKQILRETKREQVSAQAELAAEKRILDALVGEGGRESTRDKFRQQLLKGELNDTEVELELSDTASPFQGFEIPGQPGASMGMMDLSAMFGKAGKTKKVKMKIGDAHGPLLSEEADKLLDEDAIKREAVELAEQDGIVFLDEIDKITTRSDARGGDVSEASLIKQYKALMATEDVTLDFTTDGIAEIATISAEVNASIENIGARRLHTVSRDTGGRSGFE